MMNPIEGAKRQIRSCATYLTEPIIKPHPLALPQNLRQTPLALI